MKIKLNIIDAGARYGIHPSFKKLTKIANFHLFEADNIEWKRLKKKYKKNSNIKIYPVALFSSAKKLKFEIREHKGLNSIYKINNKFLSGSDYKIDQFKTVSTKYINSKTIDDFFESSHPNYLKLDVEGAELEIIKGAKKRLADTIVGIRSEVTF